MKQNKNQELGKLPPQSIEFEEAVLGALMLESNAFLKITDILQAESFYKDSHQKIFRAISDLFNKNQPIDMLTVVDILRKKNELEDIGGPFYLTNLTRNVGGSTNIEFHARIIQQKYIQREMIVVGTIIQESAYDETEDVNEVIEIAQAHINRILENSVKKMGRLIGETGRKRLEVLSKISRSENHTIGVPSWKKADKIMGGWQKSNLIIIAARPAMGKTRIAQEIANISSTNNYPVAFFSLEMSEDELYDRALSAETGIENMDIRRANFTSEQWTQIEQAQRNIERKMWIIDESAALTVTDFRAKSILYKKQYGIELIIVDYLQLMRSPTRRQREQEVSDISRTLKAVAKELNVPVIALSQLNRKVEERHDKTPTLADLRESGAIEQDADVIIFIHRPEYYEKNPEPEIVNLIELIYAKQRHATTGTIQLWKTPRWTSINETNDILGNNNQEDVF